jgi:hypothetical protein
MTKMLRNTAAIRRLAESLQKCRCVSKFDSEQEPEAWRLAHSLSDLEQSFREILDNHLPVLCRADGEEETHDALLEPGEELRHILYHSKDPKFFAYLIED